MKKIFLLLTLLFICTNSFAGPSIKIVLDKSDKRYSCGEKFKGLLHPEDLKKRKYLKLRIIPEGFAKKVKYNITYTKAGYKDISLEQTTTYKTSRSKLKIPVHRISDMLPFAVNHVFVKATDGVNSAKGVFKYRVNRDLIFQKSADEELDCFTMHKAEKISGIYANPSSQPRSISIEDSRGNSYSESRALKIGWSVSVSPYSMITIGFNMEYIRSTTRSTFIGTNVSTTTRIMPGEAIVAFKQRTLFKDSYDVFKVDECGNQEPAGSAQYHHWLFSYPMAYVDVSAENPLKNLEIGYNDQMNTCKDDFDTGDDDDIFIPDAITALRTNLKINNPKVYNDLNKNLVEGADYNPRHIQDYLNAYKATIR